MFRVLNDNEPKQYVCGWNADRLRRVVCGNIIDYTHADGSRCTHKAIRLYKQYTKVA